MPDSLNHLLCEGNKYLYISDENARIFNLKQTPNYNDLIKPIQQIWLAKRRLKKLKYILELQRHIDEFCYRPGNSGYLKIADRNKRLFNFEELDK